MVLLCHTHTFVKSAKCETRFFALQTISVLLDDAAEVDRQSIDR